MVDVEDKASQGTPQCPRLSCRYSINYIAYLQDFADLNESGIPTPQLQSIQYLRRRFS